MIIEEIKFVLILALVAALIVCVPVIRAHYAHSACSSLCGDEAHVINVTYGIPWTCECRRR